MTRFIRVAIIIAAFFTASSAFAACHTVTPSGSGSKNGTDWNNAYAGIPGTLVRGDVYYLADGTYSSYHFNTSNSGATIVEFRKAQSYDNCTSTGWNTSSMGSGQANLGGVTVSTGYVTFNGNGTQTTPGCGAGGSNFTTGTNAALIAAIKAAPPNPKDCGIHVTGVYFDTQNGTTNDTWKYVEILADSNPADNDDYPIMNSGNYSETNGTWFHCFGHNSAATYFVYTGHNRTSTYNYWWGTEVQGPDNNGTHGQYDQETNGANNTVDAYSVMRDIAGTAVWTFLSGGSVSGWKIYGNVIYNTPGNSIGGASDAVLDCINSVNCSGFTFNQNTIMTGPSGPYGPQGGVNWGDASGGSVTVENNLWYNIASTLAALTPGPGSMTEDHNSVLNSSSPGGFNAATDVKVGSGGPNPFVSSSGNNFTLVSDSADWNNRASLLAPYSIDAEGVTFTTDRGAYEYSTSVSQAPQPPTNLLVLSVQ
jgi:hypothetical protein